MMTTLSLSISTKSELRMSHKILSAPYPPDAVRGIEGLRTADAILKKHHTHGLLIGGTAKELWGLHRNRVHASRRLNKHKDVDVAVLSFDRSRQLQRFEGGIDWWQSNHFNEPLVNGKNFFLDYNFVIKPDINLPTGLYLCPSDILKGIIEKESQLYKARKFNIDLMLARHYKVRFFLPVMESGLVAWRYNPVTRATHP